MTLKEYLFHHPTRKMQDKLCKFMDAFFRISHPLNLSTFCLFCVFITNNNKNIAYLYEVNLNSSWTNICFPGFRKIVRNE